ncbi:glycosyltransferase [Pseudodesulfovibrio cashew]|uniref:Glycosyltransferase n=1 Tax=Pseudodesulfovibrio cashew TaxID=2678688 RepID=A0A6I6JIG9_9BACT|nr:glycosyltransferase family A protein [Pseudodesulfovibrio cashew]QGY40939.1 glycosyltransferase [Pseudodesulfovibrio cashew]
MDDILISIILPTYNRARFLPRALDSVLKQTHERWEVILVDDGSTDETAEVLRNFPDPRIRCYFQENRGVSAARNMGYTQCSGEMMALLDSDDEWMPTKLEIQLRYMRENGFEISQTNEIWYRGGKRVNQPAKYAKPEGWFFEAALSMCLISPACTMFTRAAWETIGPFDESMPSCEDYDMWLRACLAFPVGLVREPLTIKHGGRADQLSNCVPCADLYRIRALVKILQCGKLDASQRALAMRELENKVAIYRQGCEKRGKTDEAEKVWNLFCMVREGKEVPLKALC